MHSIPRAIPAALAVLVLALSLGLWQAASAEAADQPSPVSTPSIVDADSCTQINFGYFNLVGNIYAYNPYYSTYLPYMQPFTTNCVSPAFCQGNPYNWQQIYLVCPGPPATIEMPATTAATCASATNFQVRVRDANGLPVLDGTSVAFQVTPFGMITGAVDTNGGEATAALNTPVRTSGTLTVTVTAGNITRTQNIDVSCSAAGTVSGGGSASASAPTQVYTVPSSMGGGGGYGGY
jgi:hypothetical protein